MPDAAPAVLVAVTAGGTNKGDTVYDLVHSLKRSPHVADFIECQGTYLCRTHNTAVLELLKRPQCTHLAFIDCDMRVPFDWLDRLLAHDVDIVGATYRRRGPPHDIMAWDVSGKEDGALHTGLVERGAIASGVFLITRRVLEVLDYPWFFMTYGKAMNAPGDNGTDTNFCNKARRAGFSVWCDYDLSRQVRHIADMEIPFEIRGLST